MLVMYCCSSQEGAVLLGGELRVGDHPGVGVVALVLGPLVVHVLDRARALAPVVLLQRPHQLLSENRVRKGAFSQ